MCVLPTAILLAECGIKSGSPQLRGHPPPKHTYTSISPASCPGLCCLQVSP